MLDDVLPYLKTVVESGASDLHIKVGSPPRSGSSVSSARCSLRS